MFNFVRLLAILSLVIPFSVRAQLTPTKVVDLRTQATPGHNTVSSTDELPNRHQAFLSAYASLGSQNRQDDTRSLVAKKKVLYRVIYADGATQIFEVLTTLSGTLGRFIGEPIPVSNQGSSLSSLTIRDGYYEIIEIGKYKLVTVTTCQGGDCTSSSAYHWISEGFEVRYIGASYYASIQM